MLNKQHSERLKNMLIAAAVIFAVLICRMAYLQLYKGWYYDKQADGNRLRNSRILSPRGLIYDIKGRPLADSVPGYALSLQPQSSYNENIIGFLAKTLSLKEEYITHRLKLAQGTYDPIIIKNNLTPIEITQIEEHRKELPGVFVDLQPQRRYKYKELAVHVLGYVGEVSAYEIEQGRFKGVQQGSIVGKGGLERSFDNLLRGTDGKKTEEVDVRGRVVAQLGRTEPLPGKSIVLTIDLDLQKAMEQAVNEQLKSLQESGVAPYARGAAVVALNPKTGAIRAMVSRPAFDPNLFVRGISEKDWAVINNDVFHPMTNKVISGEYPPGSTFKVVTGSAALDLKKVTPEELIFDSGQHWLIPMGNAGGEALGWINFQTAFAMSDNVYFYEMGRRVGLQGLSDYAHKYGFGSTTGIELVGEAAGLVPSAEMKKKLYGGEWGLGDTFNNAIGQGLTLATPLQLAQMLATVAMDGKRYQPHIVERLVNDDGSLYKVPDRKPPVDVGVGKDTLALIRKGLEGVTQAGGTASYFANLPIRVGGKTGTAENPHGQDHGLFIAYGPTDDPEIVVAAVVEQGSYGSTAAGPIVYKVLEAYAAQRAAAGGK